MKDKESDKSGSPTLKSSWRTSRRFPRLAHKSPGCLFSWSREREKRQRVWSRTGSLYDMMCSITDIDQWLDVGENVTEFKSVTLIKTHTHTHTSSLEKKIPPARRFAAQHFCCSERWTDASSRRPRHVLPLLSSSNGSDVALKAVTFMKDLINNTL